MQQTKLDRWLRSKYSYITRVYSNTKPAKIPSGIAFDELKIQSGSPYRYRFSSRNEKTIDKLAKLLQSEKITFTSRVEDLDTWYSKFINNPKKSFTYRLFWIGCLGGIGLFALSPVPKLFWDYVTEEEANLSDLPAKKGPAPKEKFAEWEGRFATPGK